MIDYATFCRIHSLREQDRLNVSQIARELTLHAETVSRWLKQETYSPRKKSKRTSKLDAYKGQIIRWLQAHTYTAAQILQRLREQGYTGGYTILKEFVSDVRPPRRAAYLTLHFAPGECAQVDWGCAGAVNVGGTRRRLSFFLAWVQQPTSMMRPHSLNR
jgi:transposase